MGMTFRQMFHSDYLAGVDFQGKDVTLTIAGVERKGLERQEGGAEQVWLLNFKEHRADGSPSILVLNRTNAILLFAMWENTDQWIGKRVTLVSERDNSPINETGWCVRVKGSPDIEKTFKVKVELPRKRPVERTIYKTGAPTEDPPEPPAPQQQKRPIPTWTAPPFPGEPEDVS